MFSTYVLPKKEIETTASNINGLIMAEGQLMRKGTAVETVSVKEALRQFISYLQSQENKVILTGHYIKRYDNAVLLSAADKDIKDKLGQCIEGFIDTHTVFRSERPGLTSYKQTQLFQHYLGESYEAHEATADVRALKRLINNQFPDQSVLYKYIEKWE